MRQSGETKLVALVALVNGLLPHAEALDCPDLRGPCSLFGEDMPKSLRSLMAAHRHDKPPDLDWPGCRVLWRAHSKNAEDPLAAARDISGEILEARAFCEPSVPALTFITGKCTSTFAVAWELCRRGLLPEWGAVLSSCQTQGRGQLRRHWHSPRGNLYVSFRLPDDPLLRGDSAALIVGWLLAEAFAGLGLHLEIKWPNDLLLGGKAKAGGILLEEKDGVILAGLGVNLAECPEPSSLSDGSAVPAVALASFFSRMPGPFGAEEELVAGGGPCFANFGLSPFALWRQLVSRSILAYSHSVQGRDMAFALGGISSRLAWKGRAVRFDEADGEELRGIFVGLGSSGGAEILLRDGARREVFSGSMRPADCGL